jgi:hypothetical protein
VYVIHFQGVRPDNLGLEPGDLNFGMDLDKDLNLTEAYRDKVNDLIRCPN